MNQELSMSPHSLVAFLQKPASEFTKADIITYIQKNDIRMINFMYPAADGRLKTLNCHQQCCLFRCNPDMWRTCGWLQSVPIYRSR